MIIKYTSDFLNSDLINALANVSQFYNVYQSTKAANYSQMISELQRQNIHIDNSLDLQTHTLIKELSKSLNEIIEQSDKIIEQNNNIISMLRGNKDGK